MVLGRQDDSLHPRGLDRAGPLLAVERRGIEQLRVGVAVTPLPVVERVGPEMHEGVGFQLLPGHLARLGHGQDGGRSGFLGIRDDGRRHAQAKENFFLSHIGLYIK